MSAAIVLLFTIATTAAASDGWLIRFSSYAAVPGFESYSVIWRDDVLFFNTNAESVDVRLLGVSNGTMQPSVLPVSLTPGRVTSLNDSYRQSETWSPAGGGPQSLYVVHVDIPPGVVVESRNQFFYDLGIPELFPVALGKTTLPIARALTPANVSQVYLGTDLGGPASRVNVGIFNAGAETASATIDLRRMCDDVVVASRTLAISPNTLVQTNGLLTGADAACASPDATTRYTVVTVSQPSLVYVSNVNDRIARDSYVIAPIVGLAVAQNSRF